MMRLTVLGASPACQNPGGACSGYLLEQDGTAVLIDCGSGVFGTLQQCIAPERVQAVVISHMHADHTLDLLQYRYYLWFLARTGLACPRLPLYLPPTGHGRLLGVSALQDPSPAFFTDTFDVQDYDATAPLRIGPFTFAFIPVVHIPHTYAMRVQGSALFAYSADSGPCDALFSVARDSDLFLCECANEESSTYPFHLTPRQAGTVARESGARRLLLTHRWWFYGKDVTVAQAQSEFSGPVELACEGQKVILAP